MSDVVVIGSGFAGLATAIRLQAGGHRVRIVERRAKVGGRSYQLIDGDYVFDMGPSLITAPELIDDVFAAAGRKTADYVQIVPLDPFYRIYFDDGRYFDYTGDQARMEAEVAKFNPRDVEGYRRFMAGIKTIYERAFADLAHQPFLRRADFAKIMPELVRLKAIRSVYGYVASYISDPYLRMVFSFHPLFLGGNPFRASSIYAIIPYLERLGGVHFAMGGMYALVEGFARLFAELGGEVVTDAEVAEILVTEGRARGVRTRDGRTFPADIVVSNADVAATYKDMIAPEWRRRWTDHRLGRMRYSMSSFLLYLGLDRHYEKFRHHTILIGDRYQGLVSDIFGGRMADDFSIYLHAPTMTDPSMAPPGHESVYLLVPVPHLGSTEVDWERDGDRFRDRIVRYLEHDFGLKDFAKAITVEHRFTPLDFERELGAYLGTGWQIEPTLFQSAYFRPHNRSEDVRGLYIAGAGTHPGAGLPGVLLSAEITAGLVAQDAPKLGPANGRDGARQAAD
jgi:phytoene desaturase